MVSVLLSDLRLEMDADSQVRVILRPLTPEGVFPSIKSVPGSVSDPLKSFHDALEIL